MVNIIVSTYAQTMDFAVFLSHNLFFDNSQEL